MTYESEIETQTGVLAGAPFSKMESDKGYRVVPFTMSRRMVAASAGAAREQNNIQGLIEVDISEPRYLILLDDLTISVVVEREIAGAMVPEPFSIRAAQTRSI